MNNDAVSVKNDITMKDLKANDPRWCTGCGDYTILVGLRKFMVNNQIERENTVKEETEAKYQFTCTKENKHSIYFCTPLGLGLSSEYSIKFSLATMRFRKSVITDYWLNGKGNEVDYVHIAHGYCYDID